jgi:hypothetical protein
MIVQIHDLLKTYSEMRKAIVLLIVAAGVLVLGSCSWTKKDTDPVEDNVVHADSIELSLTEEEIQ